MCRVASAPNPVEMPYAGVVAAASSSTTARARSMAASASSPRRTAAPSRATARTSAKETGPTPTVTAGRVRWCGSWPHPIPRRPPATGADDPGPVSDPRLRCPATGHRSRIRDPPRRYLAGETPPRVAGGAAPPEVAVREQGADRDHRADHLDRRHRRGRPGRDRVSSSRRCARRASTPRRPGPPSSARRPSSRAAVIPDAQVRAKESEAEAERARLEAEQAAERAQEARGEVVQEEATVRGAGCAGADRLDPDVNHKCRRLHPRHRRGTGSHAAERTRAQGADPHHHGDDHRHATTADSTATRARRPRHRRAARTPRPSSTATTPAPDVGGRGRRQDPHGRPAPTSAADPDQRDGGTGDTGGSHRA